MKTKTVPWDYNRTGTKTVNDERVYAAEPWAEYWKQLSLDKAQQLKEQIGEELHGQFIDKLPEEFFITTSYQIRAKSFERCLKAVHELPLGTVPTVQYLLDHYQYKREA